MTGRNRVANGDVCAGLSARPKVLPPRLLYDAQGRALFEKLIRLPGYYVTEAERSILAAHAPTIADLSDADTVADLGAGGADNTLLLLETIPSGGTRMITVLGGAIGNHEPAGRARLFERLVEVLHSHDTLLLGFDLVKDPARLVHAYDDDSGVAAAFNKNALAVINRDFGASFDLDLFEHVARWDPVNEWIELRLRSIVQQRVTVRDLGITVEFAAGEEMRTEISAKFRRDRVRRELASAGLESLAWLPDAAGDYAVVLARKAQDGTGN